MREGNLDVFALKVNYRVKTVVRHVVVKQIFQTVARQYSAAVVHNCKAGVEVCVVAQHNLDEFAVKLIVLEQSVVGLKEDVRSVLVLRVLGLVGCQHAFLECCRAHLSVAVRAHLEVRAQGVYRLCSHAVQTDALLERLAVVFSSGVEYAYRLDEFSLRNASSVVSHAYAQIVFHVNLDALSGVHLELVDTVINDFFQQDVNSVFLVTSVAQFSDVHSGTCPDMLHVRQVADVVICIINSLFLAWNYLFFCHLLNKSFWFIIYSGLV